MGCFGDMEETKRKESTSTVSPPSWVQQAGQENYNLAKSILDRGFVPYTGERIAPLSGNERAAGDLVARTAASPNPYTNDMERAFGAYGAAPAFNYDFNTIVDQSGPLGSIDSYMDPYLAKVLAPTLRQLNLSGEQARNDINANATTAGAFGDARHGVVEGEQRRNQNQQETDVVGKAFSDAFATAMGLRSSDAARYFQTQQAQEGADKSRLDRMRTSAIDLGNLDKDSVSRALGLSDALAKTGATERGVEQAGSDFDYNEFLRQTNFTNNEIAFLTSILAGTPTAKTTTGTVSQLEPNNSGWEGVGALGGALLSMI